MSELHKFLFDGLPVRGAIVRLTDAWQEILQRRAVNTSTGPYPLPVQEMLGEMTAAGVLMQSNIKFNGALVFQISGDGPVKLAVTEVLTNLSVRSTVTMIGDLPADATLTDMVNVHGKGRCAITLDPKDKQPGQQPYQGVVPLVDVDGQPLESMAAILQQYMRQSEQLDTVLVLAANDKVAAGLIVQRMPIKGEANLAAGAQNTEEVDQIGLNEEYNRIAHLAASLTRDELLNLDVETILHRLFWEEKLLRFVPEDGEGGPHFACTCSRERVGNMLRSLGQEESDSILEEQGMIEVGCEFCGQQYRFDAVDVAHLFTERGNDPPASSLMQ
ncbi:MAG: Hsp33 family molecular chaperone HslO [Comamonas sp.]|uniref:Hsp33 family molecular chaperone HslO n=1 Tax=Comamonas sp. JUb58 TaxID=2485114 RepID=UPI00105CB13A|nr:Hsp33 family molecular chaperone HslO [Comamonas sp. JUb58]MDR0260264.1 Hsp33 family molecular chaperone HslO [Comamonas sp.]MDR2330073.1 Hsp33 family molecular chaperone HslO [Comamonas sp.]TDS78233.1 molecular chaperone Hsp33 [Comamonas sp. JUb58]